MNNQMQIFEHERFGQVRIIEIENQPWFVGKDVAERLGYGNYRQALKSNVDAEDKDVHSMDTLGGRQNITVINESGLYSLILSSKLPQAKEFKRWVTSEILPSLRKYGAYATAETVGEMLQNPKFAGDIIKALAEEHVKNGVLEDKILALSPKAYYFDRVLMCGEAVQTSIIAKDYGMSATAFNRLLYALGIQYKMGCTWLLYQMYTNKGYTKTKTFYTPTGMSVIHTYWTQSGRQFLYQVLAQVGIYPLHYEQLATEGF